MKNIHGYNGFLADQLKQKIGPIQQKLKNTEDAEKIETLKSEVIRLEQKYDFDTWLDNAANRMAIQLKFGTHISKGVHPSSKGDNINFTFCADNLPDGCVGSQTLTTLPLDANGNAAALPLAAFFDTLVGDDEIKLRDLIQCDHSALSGTFSNDHGKSDEYQESFKAALLNPLTAPRTYEGNKQIFWPLEPNSIPPASDNYICLVPLYPSAFTHELYGRINNARYSESNKLARDNRNKKTEGQKPYVSISDLARTILGGSNSQNVSKLTGEKRGCNYLLPSLPPQINCQIEFSISKRHHTIFNSSLRYYCYLGVQELFSVIEAPNNTIDVREQRKVALDKILAQILSIAVSIQKRNQAGWSKVYQLDPAEKFWLDPERAYLEGEEEFAEQRIRSDWINQIERSFSLWLNHVLKEKFKKQRFDFNDAEHLEWLKEMRAAIKASQRAKEGVFT